MASMMQSRREERMIYNPEDTLFLKRGRKQGARGKNGLEMLHLQAIASWEFWNE